MLTKKLSPIYFKRFTKYFSIVAETNPQNNVEEISHSGNLQEQEILKEPDYFNVHKLVSVKKLFNARVHYGHKIESLNNHMKPFIFGSRLGHTIFDLEETTSHLRKALNITAHIAYRDGIILFVSQRPMITLYVENTAKHCGEYAVTRDWRMGTFTNAEKIFQCFVRLPDLCIVLNTLLENGQQHPVIKEAVQMLIPTVGIVDSDCDPTLITYPVPGNDDSECTLKFYCDLFKTAIMNGKNKKKEHLLSSSEGKKIEENQKES